MSSQANINSPCPHYNSGHCRSCSELSKPRTQELVEKQARVEQLAESLRSKPRVLPIFSPKIILPSRGKAKLQVHGSSDNPVVGLVQLEKNTVHVRSLVDCPLHLEPINEILEFLQIQGIREAGLLPYDVETRKGELKGFVLISNGEGNELILRFIARSRAIEHHLKKFVPTLLEKFPVLKVVSLNIQPVHQAVIDGPEEIFLTEAHTIQEAYPGFQLEFGPQSFKQVSYESATALYLRARELASQAPVDNLVDLYCGTGGFSLALAPVVKCGLGIEISKDAVESAIRQSHSFPHLTFQVADADIPLENLFALCPDLLVVNPPRRGLSEMLVRGILDAKPERVLYSSCNPETLKRDLLLLEQKYIVQELHPFDMFPQTAHLEILSLLTLSDENF